MKLINADVLEKTLRDWIRDHWTEAYTGDDAGAEFADMIDHAETMDTPLVVHAHWIPECPNKRNGKAYRHTCSECGRSVYDARQVSIDELGYVFCPHCGAKMDEPDTGVKQQNGIED